MTTPAGDPAGSPGVDDLDPAAALGAAVAEGDSAGDAGPGDTPEQQAAYWKDRARKNEDWAKRSSATVRANEAALKELEEIKARDKTEAQKAEERALKAEARAAEADRREWARDAAEEHEIPAKFRSRITGTTQDEITASAKALAADLKDMREEIEKANKEAPGAAGGSNGQQPQAPGRQRRPVATLRPGAAPADSATQTSDPDVMFRQMIDKARGR
jgi:hypothetical protein